MTHDLVFSVKSRKVERVDLTAKEIAAREKANPILPHMVDDERDRRINGGIEYQGRSYQTDSISRVAIADNAAAAFRSTVADPDGKKGLRWSDERRDFVWIAADNSLVRMTAKEMQSFGDAVAAFEYAVRLASRRLKDRRSIPRDYSDDKYWP